MSLKNKLQSSNSAKVRNILFQNSWIIDSNNISSNFPFNFSTSLKIEILKSHSIHFRKFLYYLEITSFHKVFKNVIALMGKSLMLIACRKLNLQILFIEYSHLQINFLILLNKYGFFIEYFSAKALK